MNWTPRANDILTHAGNIAREHGHDYVGAEHVFLACCLSESPLIRRMLTDAGVQPSGFAFCVEASFKKLAEQSKATTHSMAELVEELRAAKTIP